MARRTNRAEIERSYVAAHAAATEHLQRLAELLGDCRAPGDDAHLIYWGHVGDLDHVNARLAELVRFLDGSAH